MNKIITIIITLMSYMAFSQTEVKDTITITDTISVVTSDTTKTPKFQYRVSFSEVSNTFSSKDLKTPIFDVFRVEPIYNETLNQFVFVSDEDVDQFELLSNFNQYHITYFKKIPIKYN